VSIVNAGVEAGADKVAPVRIKAANATPNATVLFISR
jgi:hypothetical protein